MDREAIQSIRHKMRIRRNRNLVYEIALKLSEMRFSYSTSRFGGIFCNLFAIKWEFREILAIFSQNGIPFYRESTGLYCSSLLVAWFILKVILNTELIVIPTRRLENLDFENPESILDYFGD